LTVLECRKSRITVPATITFIIVLLQKMRVKQIFAYVPLTKAKLVWDRLTFSKLTTAYFIFSVIHCLVQLALQVRAFTINANAANFLFNISQEAGAFNNSLVPWYTGSELLLCPDVPPAFGYDQGRCTAIFNGTAINNNVTSAQLAASVQSSSNLSVASSSVAPSSSSSASASSSTSASSASSTPTPVSTPVSAQRTVKTVSITQTQVVHVAATPTSQPADQPNDEHGDNGISAQFFKRQNPDLKFMVNDSPSGPQVNVSLANQLDNPTTLSSDCLWSLNYPVLILGNTKREDIVFMAFQFWVLGMSLVALLNESIPHIIASLLTHVMATAWAGYQIQNTLNFETDFRKVITEGACSGVPPFLGGFWKTRQEAEYASLALNIAALLVSPILSWKLFKCFGWQTFKRVGASLTINRIYKLVLILSIVLQLSLFFMAAAVGLWIDSLMNGVASVHADHRTLYRITSIATIVLLVPWVSTGYIGVRKELRLSMLVFLLLSILYLAGWGVMFLAFTFRWEFMSWAFFSVVATLSCALTVSAFILGVVCRLNFGKGLLRYLNAQEQLPGDDFMPVTYGSDPEKVDFPSTQQPIPTFSATFGKGNEVPVPSQMFPAQLGPRFFRSTPPFDSRSVSPISAPSMAHTRSSVISDSPHSDEGAPIMRSNTTASDQSFRSVASYYKYSDDGNHSRSGSTTEQTMHGKRWIIE